MNGITLTLQLIALILIIKGCISATIHDQNGCYNTNVILSCPHYTQTKPGKLVWRFYDKTASTWTQIASIRHGKSKLFSANTALNERAVIHPNGSLGISSLHPDDETRYQCLVKQGRRKLHVVKLSVTCGRVTLVKREVCIEEDVVLDCESKHRTNPRKLNQIKWHKKNTSGNDVSWSLLVATSGSNVTVGDGFKLHGNGSLLLQGGRYESDVTYKCDVTKNVASRLDRHIIVVKNVKCRSEKIEAGTVKTAKGRIAMTKPSPLVKGASVTMETTSGSVTKPSVAATRNTISCGGVLTGPIGGFQSPNFPSTYPANSHCKWTISVPQAYAAINVTLRHVNIEQEAKCRNDFVAIYDHLGNQVGCGLCGVYNNSIEIQVRGTVAVVVFRSDSSVQKTGFRLSYKGVKTAADPDS